MEIRTIDQQSRYFFSILPVSLPLSTSAWKVDGSIASSARRALCCLPPAFGTHAVTSRISQEMQHVARIKIEHGQERIKDQVTSPSTDSEEGEREKLPKEDEQRRDGAGDNARKENDKIRLYRKESERSSTFGQVRLI